jgi:hypothetical protein
LVSTLIHSTDSAFILAGAYGMLVSRGLSAEARGGFRWGEDIGDAASWADSYGSRGGKGLWELSPKERGVVSEGRLGGNNLGQNFRTFDNMDWSAGTATSLKTMDLATRTYANSQRIISKASEYAREAHDFTFEERAGVRLTSEDIRTRVVRVGIPEGATPLQEWAMFKASAKAAELGIKMEWIVLANE